LLQEVRSIPKVILERYDVLSRVAICKSGKPQRFRTAVVKKGKITGEIQLSSKYDWVNRELDFFKGNLIGCTIELFGRPFKVISVYSPAWPVSKDKLQGIDVSQVRLTSNSKIWATEILWAALQKVELNGKDWIVGGDFNSSETFDVEWQVKNGIYFGIKSSGNKEILDRMTTLGFAECLRKYNNDRIIPTFKHSRGEIAHQMDHLFVTEGLVSSLKNCVVGDPVVVFDKLSDHLPVIVDISFD
jgi:exonuclease III